MTDIALTETGLETALVFHHGIELPHFAAFPLLDDPVGRTVLATVVREHVHVAADLGASFVLETPTWRASADWGEKLGYDGAGLDRVNRDAVAFVRTVAADFPNVSVTVSGTIGPRGDGYAPEEVPTVEASRNHHRAQIASFRAAGADRATALTITHASEATGIVLAAVDEDLPVVVSFTVETDGRLPSGQPLLDAIDEVDGATGAAALFFGVNCAHPDHFAHVLLPGDPRTARLQLVRANASRRSHAELDAAGDLDDGDVEELASLYRALLDTHPHLGVLGGCCGTDRRHLAAIGRACA